MGLELLQLLEEHLSALLDVWGLYHVVDTLHTVQLLIGILLFTV